MDISQLQAFDQIVRLGSFSKAARALNVSQPTISVRIQGLEQAVGCALFVRGGSRLELTEQGLHFLPYARQALEALITGIEVTHQSIQGKHGSIVIGTLPSLTTSFFSSTLVRLHATHPNLDITIHTAHTQQIVEMLLDGAIKLGFLVWPFFSPEVTVLLHIHEPLLIVTRADHPLAQRPSIAVSELETLANPFVYVHWNDEVKHWQSLQRAAGKVGLDVPPQTAYDLVQQGIGATLLTHTLVANDLKEGRLVEVEVQGLPSFRRESVLVKHKRDEKMPLHIKEFIRIFREEARIYCKL
ncbi:nitrogen assimilation transcriptional activator [Ktedonobacter sp. SOSP1-52]|uniref:LysR family transcriptional regulator n=1 Tax=Ktedonobacter sp. SOSP1-52 TaxID=2778366 RepID=UPI0019153C4D|nr:LysR family transcriptional regulator [Ktedonobacter sp. SOSP1-52]GHO64619.1 nitrogen assimilation transcriptional activator [Ktedonobacter sp. SOSP1-52]